MVWVMQMKNLNFSALERKVNLDELTVKKKVLEKDSRLHWHNFFEIEVITDGNGTQILNGQEYPLKRGCVYMLLPTDYHEVKIQKNVELYNINFHETMLSEEFLQVLSSEQHDNNVFYFDEDDLKEIIKVCSLIEVEFNRSKKYKNEFLKSILECFLILILRKAQFENNDTNESEKNYIKKAILYMQLYFKDNPSLSDTASAVNLNSDYFSHIFKKSTGKSYIEYLTDLKLSYSKKILRSTNLTVTEVCFASGFASLSNFMKVFKEKTGMSPSVYAKQKKSKQG